MPPYKRAPPQRFMENKNAKSQGKNRGGHYSDITEIYHSIPF